MSSTPRPHQILLFRPPYRMLVPLSGLDSLARAGERQGAALVWCMGSEERPALAGQVRRRPGGLPLFIILPRVHEVERPQDLFRLVEQCRPQNMLPFHEEPSPTDLATLLARTPADLPAAVVEYLSWRGLVMDLDLRRTLRRVLELSGEIRTVSGLARGMYMSRRALARRFLREGLPVPSHWLHFGRVLRVALALQRPGATLMSTAFDHGYADGFSLSNQMKRLTGLRPSRVMARLGWEWIVEAWIHTEVQSAGFRADRAQFLARRASAAPGGTGRVQDERQPA